MSNHRPPTEQLQQSFCDALEARGTLSRRYDTGHRERLTMAGKAVHWWLTSLDLDHEGKAASMTLADFANAYAEAAGGMRTFPTGDTQTRTPHPLGKRWEDR